MQEIILFKVFFNFVILCYRHDRSKAVEILVKDLKVFATFNEELFKEITQLLTLENFRYLFKFQFTFEFGFCKMCSD